MTFDAIRANTALMKEEATNQLGGLSDAELEALKYDTAYIKLKRDLSADLNYSEVNDDILNDVADKYTNDLQLALTYKQLEVYFDSDITLGGMSEYKVHRFKEEYSNIRKSFKTYQLTVSHKPGIFRVKGYKG